MPPSIRIPKGWETKGLQPTPEWVYLNRRSFLRNLALAGISIGGTAVVYGAGSWFTGCAGSGAGDGPELPPLSLKPIAAPRNPAYALDRPLTEEAVAAGYNNFYEFTENKERVGALARRFTTRPWSVEVGGHVRRPRTFDVDELRHLMPIEERLYRHRCVEAWAMAVPWVGFPLKALLDLVEPLGSARFVRLVSFKRPEEAPNQKPPTHYPWPYFEALRIDEAMNPLTLMAIGIYGHELPPQHGAPLRLVAPWKYGFKSIKSVVQIELTDKQPPTFWNVLSSREYDFLANVDPGVPHPRWSQASERMIGTWKSMPTLKYNGYAELVAGLYPA
jgi:sulfoxide reductase catalytic subunit YedY